MALAEEITDLVLEEPATVMGFGGRTRSFDSYEKLLTKDRLNDCFTCTERFEWTIEPYGQRSLDGKKKHGSWVVRSISFRHHARFDASKYFAFKDHMLVGFLKIKLFSNKNILLVERESFATESIPSNAQEMPLRVELNMVPIEIDSGHAVFEFQWGFVKRKETALNAKQDVRHTRFDLQSYAMSDKFSDVVFEVCNSTLPAHKLILAAKSPVFEAIFNHEMKEKKTSRVVIEDIAPEVFQELLRFFYTDDLPTEVLEKHGTSLLLAADKYDLPKLVDLCTPYAISNKMSSEDVLRLYMLASSNGNAVNSALKERIIKLIKARGKTFTKSETFLKFMKDDLRTAAEILNEIV